MTDGLRYEIDGRLITLFLKGNYTVDQLLGLVESALAEVSLPERAMILIDGRESEVDRTTPEVRRIVEAYGVWAPKIERVAVVTGSDAHFGMMRMAEVLSEEKDFDGRVFRSLEPALKWLGVRG